MSKKLWAERGLNEQLNWSTYLVIFLLAIPVLWSFTYSKKKELEQNTTGMSHSLVSAEHSGLMGRRGEVIEAVDPRVGHVAKWVLSVGDAVAVGDVNNDGLPDIFLTQPLKCNADQGKLYLNKGNFQFEKVIFPALEQYIGNPKSMVFLVVPYF